MFRFSKRGARAKGNDSSHTEVRTAVPSGRPKLLTTRVDAHGPVSVITVNGEIDESTASLFVERVQEQMTKSSMVIVDLTRVTFLGVAGNQALRRVNASRSQTGSEWIVVPGPAARRALKLIDIGEQIPTAETIVAAWAMSGHDRG